MPTRFAATHPLAALMAERDFRLLLVAQVGAQCADGVAQAAFADTFLLEPSAQGTPERILAVFALTLVPYSLVAPFLGVFVDRWDRRATLAGANLVRSALLVTLPLWSRALPGDAALLVALLGLLGFGRLFLTAKSAALPVVLHEHHLLRGNALSGGAGMIAALVGGALGFAGVGLLPPSAVFVAAGFAYGGAALLARRMSGRAGRLVAPSERLGAALRRVASELVEGLREVWSRPAARLSLSGIFILRSAVMLSAIAVILVIRARYPAAGDRFGRLSAGALALGTSSAGALAGAFTVPRLGARLGTAGSILVGFAVSGVGMALLGGVENLSAVLSLTAVGGFGAYIAKVATDAQVQQAVPDAFRGRAFALYDILYNLASVVAAAVVVAAAGASARALLVPAGAAVIVIAGVLGASMRRAGMLDRAPWRGPNRGA